MKHIAFSGLHVSTCSHIGNITILITDNSPLLGFGLGEGPLTRCVVSPMLYVLVFSVKFESWTKAFLRCIVQCEVVHAMYDLNGLDGLNGIIAGWWSRDVMSGQWAITGLMPDFFGSYFLLNPRGISIRWYFQLKIWAPLSYTAYNLSWCERTLGKFGCIHVMLIRPSEQLSRP